MKHKDSLTIPLEINYEWGSNQLEDDTAGVGFVHISTSSVTQEDNVRLCMSRGQMHGEEKRRGGERDCIFGFKLMLWRGGSAKRWAHLFTSFSEHLKSVFFCTFFLHCIHSIKKISKLEKIIN